jgi:hypothetical protein
MTLELTENAFAAWWWEEWGEGGAELVALSSMLS